MRNNINRARRRPSPIVLLMAAVAVGFVALPLLGILQRADWSTLVEDLSTSQSRDALRLSLVCSFAAAGLSVLFGTPLAWVLARSTIPGRAVLRALVLVPMVLPPVVGGVALLTVFGKSAWLGSWLFDRFGVQLTFSTAGAIMAATFVALPFYVIAAEAGLRAMDVRYESVAASLGASRFTVFRRVTLPMMLPAAAAGAVLAWARALGEFGATVTFAGNIVDRTQTLPLAVYLQLETDQDTAIALSLVLLAVSLVVLVALRDRWVSRL
jgi:molybdate transport system permease protein